MVRPFVYILSVAATEALWPAKPKIFMNWSFTKEACWSLLYLKLYMLQSVPKVGSKYVLMRGIIFPKQRAERNFSWLPQQGDNTMQRTASLTAFFTVNLSLWFTGLLLMMDGTYRRVSRRNFQEGECNTTLVQSASLIWLNPKTRHLNLGE